MHRILVPGLLLLLQLCLSPVTQADVVKPALIEISINTDGSYRIEVRASLEALLTGINARYRNTQDAPNAEAYDALRVLPAGELATAFEAFESTFTERTELRLDGDRVPLTITSIDIPEPGYPKVPRISVITLAGEIDRSARSLTWYYPEAFGDNAVRVRQVDEENEQWHWSDWQWLRSDRASEPFSLTELFTRQSTASVIGTYLVLGFEHIIPYGMDHILFILGIFLLSTHLRPLLLQVTMFTVAHTITLGLSMAGVINLPDNVVEPLIALSIAYIGFENVFAHSLHKSRLLIVFLFGLLHGMGFASILADFGMPQDAFLTALISFNVGVELGQVAVILLAYLAVGVWGRDRDWYRPFVVVPASLIIAVIGLYWTWDRIVI